MEGSARGAEGMWRCVGRGWGLGQDLFRCGQAVDGRPLEMKLNCAEACSEMGFWSRG